MKRLHIAAHLGGGVGKAHSALCAVGQGDAERHYLLLEEPRDRRHVDAIRASGATVSVLGDATDLRARVAAADIVQVEWWNHPRLYHWLCRADLPAARTLFWCHISGLFAPYVPQGLLSAGHRFLFTSACSLEGLPPGQRNGVGVVNSGFGFAGPAPDLPGTRDDIAYLGTVDFAKMSPWFFDVVDRAGLDRPVRIWGAVEPDGAVAQAAKAMRAPDAVRFHGHADDPEAALRRAGIFLYLLQPCHFGTAENALIEAMSLGCVPLVFDNPAERAIVDHGRTGFVEQSVDAAAERLRWMLAHPAEVRAMGCRAAVAMAETRSVEKSAADFASLYRTVLSEEKRVIDYPALLGSTPADWFLSTQGEARYSASADGPASKGSLAHFLHYFPEDRSLLDLMQPERTDQGLRGR